MIKIQMNCSLVECLMRTREPKRKKTRLEEREKETESASVQKRTVQTETIQDKDIGSKESKSKVIRENDMRGKNTEKRRAHTKLDDKERDKIMLAQEQTLKESSI